MIDLQQFCSTEETRYYLTKPLSRDGFTWATNGHILVRVGLRPNIGDNEGSLPSTKSMNRILSCHDNATFSPFPLVTWPDDPPAPPCEYCGGAGKCDDDRSSWQCDDCDGTGRGVVRVSVLVRGYSFDAKYVRLIAALPNAEFADKACNAWASPPEPTPFRFGGGVGAVMSIRGEFKHHLGDIENLRAR
jgi:hypothetical protein